MGGRAELRALTGLRGVAALVVMLYHFSEQHLASGLPEAVLDRGYLMVDLFFVLSGFVAAHRYGPAFRAGLRAEALLSFLAQRLIRLWPVYLLCLALALLLARHGLVDLPFERHAPGDVLANLLMIQSWGLSESFDAPAWSASTEWAACLLTPLLLPLCLFRSRRLATTLGLLAVAALGALSATPTAWLGAALRAGPLDIYAAATPAPLLRCLCGFVIGLLSYRLTAARTLHRAAPCLAAAALLAGLALPLPDVVIVLLAAALVAALAHQPDALLGRGAPHWLGERSYPLYLLHYLLLPALKAGALWLAAAGLPHPAGLALCAACIIAVLLAHAVHVGLERPLRLALIGLLDAQGRRAGANRPAAL